jgi:hypothetical protein
LAQGAANAAQPAPQPAPQRAPQPVPSALESAAVKVVEAVADTLPVVVLGGLALAATRSSVRVGIGKLLEQSDTLVVAATAALGWGVTQYVKHVDGRFDAAERHVEQRFDAADRARKERFDALKQSLDKVLAETRARLW